MRVIVCKNYEEISLHAARLVASQLMLKPESVLGLATGSTPIGLYENLAKMNSDGEIDFSKVRTFNLDEYYPIERTNSQSYHYFMNEHLFSKININPENTNIPDGETDDPKRECEEYERKILQSGGIDLQILGIGQNGHIGFNEPDINLCSTTHVAKLTENTIEANSRFFDKKEDVPRYALTMGISSILKSKKIILIASGKSKHTAVEELLNEEISTKSPATMLKVHPDVVLICDKEAYSSYHLGVDIGGTETKFGVFENGKLVEKDSVATDLSSAEALVGQIVNKYNELSGKYPITKVGAGVPGSIIDNAVTSANLPFDNYNLKKELAERLETDVSVENDANCAALGEAVNGVGKGSSNLLMITLGTGIGGGIIIDGKIYHGRGNAGEIGHMIINRDGAACPCGQKGCFEQYASVNALVKMAVEAAENDSSSVLYSVYKKHGRMSGRIFFEALAAKCPLAESVLDRYAQNLSVGVKSLINIFSPDLVVLAGGIATDGEVILNALFKHLKTDVPVKISSLRGDAGIYGAAEI